MITISNSNTSGLSQFIWSIEDAIRSLAADEMNLDQFEVFLVQAHEVVCYRESRVLQLDNGASEELTSELKLAKEGLRYMRVGLERLSEFLIEDNVDHLEVGHSQVYHGYELLQDSLNRSDRKQRQFEAELQALPKSA